MKATFLLGSGISVPANLPSVGRLTDTILSGDRLVIDSNGVVVDENEFAARWVEIARESMLREPREKVRRIRLLLDWLKVQANARYAEIEGRSVNYEDLAYLAGQISDDLIDEYENPALQPFIRNALIDLGGLFPDTAHNAAREELRKLAQSAMNYIRQVVALQLNKADLDASYLQAFAGACKDPLISKVNLFTLNHDTLLERFLRKNEIELVDGLKACNGDGSRRWDPSVFKNPKGERRVNLFKLHGSISWRYWGPKSKQDAAPCENADQNQRFIGSYKMDGLLYTQHDEDEGPHILAGTFNKMLRYNSELFLELHHRFHKALQDCKTLVVCGYGFGDKGINTRIAEWRHKASHPKLLIIDPAEPCAIYRKARGAIAGEIAALCPEGAIDSIPPGPVIHWRSSLQDRSESTGAYTVTWERIRAVLKDC